MPDNCPKCGMNFIGDPIPENIAEHYAGTHWHKEIGIDGSYMGIYDGLVAYMCPDCKHYFPRANTAWAKDIFEQFLEKMKEEEDE